MVDNIKLIISSEKDKIAGYMSTIRLTTSSIASNIGFDIDEIDDIKVSLGEACTNIIKHGLKEGEGKIEIEYNIYDDKLTIIVKDTGKGFDTSKIKDPNIEELNESGLGIFIIKALMDEVNILSSDNNGTEIVMTKIKNV